VKHCSVQTGSDSTVADIAKIIPRLFRLLRDGHHSSSAEISKIEYITRSQYGEDRKARYCG
jgi:hypothetical protein